MKFVKTLKKPIEISFRTKSGKKVTFKATKPNYKIVKKNINGKK